MHLVIKPDGMGKFREIDSAIQTSGFKVESLHHIADWTTIGREIYLPQIKASREFLRASEIYFSLSQELFGKEGLLYWLSANEEQPISDLEKLLRFKKAVRSDLKTIHDKGLALLINTVQLVGVEQQGTAGNITIDGKEILPFNSEGHWVYFFFKYIHSSDPNLLHYRHEIDVLNKAGIFEKKYAEREIKEMREKGIAFPRF